MPDAESFVAAIAANPADDLPRLVYADWLDENGYPARAGFIRDHVRLAKTRPGTDEYKTLYRKCADTLRANLPAWIKPACDAFGQPAEWKPGKAVGGRFPIEITRTGERAGLRAVQFERGFVGSASVTLIPSTPVRGLDELLRQCPVTELTLRSIIDTENWTRVQSDRLRTVRSLHLLAVSSRTVTDRIFTSDVFAGVTRLTALVAKEIDVLCRSRMAKQLTSLTVAGYPEVITALAEYPLDDKLQEFAIAPPGRDTPRMADWSPVSRVAFRPTLKRLELTRCVMTDDGLATFARGEEWIRLQGLKLGGNLFGDRGWADFCRGWRTPELAYLDVSRNRLTDSGAEMLSRSGMLKTLRVIDLRGNRIAGRGAVALARAIAEGKVNKLLLAGNPLGKRETATVKGLLGGRTDVANGAT